MKSQLEQKVTVESLLRHLESGWNFCKQLHDLVEFFITANVKHVYGYPTKTHYLQTIAQTDTCLKHENTF